MRQTRPHRIKLKFTAWMRFFGPPQVLMINPPTRKPIEPADRVMPKDQGVVPGFSQDHGGHQRIPKSCMDIGGSKKQEYRRQTGPIKYILNSLTGFFPDAASPLFFKSWVRSGWGYKPTPKSTLPDQKWPGRST